MIYVIAMIACALGLYRLLLNHTFYFKKRGIPQITPAPVFGNMLSIVLRRESVADLVQRLYSMRPEAKYVGVYEIPKLAVMLRDPELIKLVTIKHFDTFVDHRGFVDDSTDELFGKNLFFMRGEKWRRMRSVLSPAFTSSKMKTMYRLMSDCAVHFADYVADLPIDRATVDTKDIFTRYSNDVVASCAFGATVDSMRNPTNEFYLHGKKATVLGNVVVLKLYLLRLMPWLGTIIQMKIIPRKVEQFFERLVLKTIKARDDSGVARPDMLQLMMDTRDKETGDRLLSIGDMAAQATVFFFGSFDTTSTLMCFAAHEIAVNPQVQARLRTEIDQVLEETNGQATYEAVNAMEYLDAVIYEALRMYPVAIVMDRVCMRDYVLPASLPGGEPFTLKKRQSVLLPIYGLHHDPKYFPQPDRFDPERFVGERKRDSLNCGAYVPFGLGPRMCIGYRFALLQVKVLLFHLLARCRLEPCAKTPYPVVFAVDGFILKPKGGFWLRLLPRQDSHRTVARNVANRAAKL